MTRYGFDPRDATITASWTTARGAIAHTVVRRCGLGAEVGMRVAQGMEALSQAVWRCYSDPDGVARDPNGHLEWCRQCERDACDDVASLLGAFPPHTGAGPRVSSRPRVVALAAHLGRVLVAAPVTGPVLDEIVAEVGQEIAALGAAERGEMVGRAEQATVLGSSDPSPAQVAAADAVLRACPLAPAREFEGMDPTAAACSAAHWFAAAAAVTARSWGGPIEHVLQASDEMPTPAPEVPLTDLAAADALVPDLGNPAARTPDTEAASTVLALIVSGRRPRDVVVDLVASARRAAGGAIPAPARLEVDFQQAGELAAEYQARGWLQDRDRERVLPQRVCALDPARPGRGLLEDLVAAIEACWSLYARSSTGRPAHPGVLDGPDGPSARSGSTPDPVALRSRAGAGPGDECTSRLRARFCADVVAEADHHHDRLL